MPLSRAEKGKKKRRREEDEESSRRLLRSVTGVVTALDRFQNGNETRRSVAVRPPASPAMWWILPLAQAAISTLGTLFSGNPFWSWHKKTSIRISIIEDGISSWFECADVESIEVVVGVSQGREI